MTALAPLLDWFSQNRWDAFDFQRQTWQAYLDGKSGLVHAPTGSGKTLAVFGGPLAERRAEPGATGNRATKSGEPFTVLWLTPMRALANDTADALRRAVEAMHLSWAVEIRTSDTSASIRTRQRKRLPTVLVTTPESLSVLISYADAREKMNTLRCVIVDEWHELMSTKRGTQTELGLARLRQWNPGLRTWGLSATLGNLEEARDVLLGTDAPGLMVEGNLDKQVRVESLIPDEIERFPWGGHMGLRMTQAVIDAIDAGASSLVFLNTRFQAEAWFKTLIEKRPDWIGRVALHHGSLDRKIR
ncbi:MAG: DEAD/DEAH box helicase, partial [Planctomycetota bacterium]